MLASNGAVNDAWSNFQQQFVSTMLLGSLAHASLIPFKHMQLHVSCHTRLSLSPYKLSSYSHTNLLSLALSFMQHQKRCYSFVVFGIVTRNSRGDTFHVVIICHVTSV